MKAIVLSRFVSQKMVFFLTKRSEEDLVLLKELIEAGKVTPIINTRYPLSEFPEAIGYLEKGHAQRKVVITV